MSRNTLEYWLRNILLIGGIYLHYEWDNIYTRILLLALAIVITYWNIKISQNYINRNIIKIKNDPNIRYKGNLEEDRKYIERSAIIFPCTVMVFLILFTFFIKYSIYFAVICIILIIIALYIDDKFEKRSNLRELLEQKDKTS